MKKILESSPATIPTKIEKSFCKLSAINHHQFDRLHNITNNYNKATLLDKLIFWWQISTYTLEDGNIWFTRSITRISEDSKISKRSVERYLQEFQQLGLIEKINVLFKKKNLYIRITDKLLRLLGEPTESIDITYIKNDIHHIDETSSSLFLNQVGANDSANLTDSIYKEEDNNQINNNTVSTPDIVNKILKPNSNYPIYKIEETIGDRISLKLKNTIKGTLLNLQKQDALLFSNPEQLFSEVVFSMINTENQFIGIKDEKHRLNLIAKLLREKRWRTPKGFYNHWDIGALYKQKEIKKEKLLHKEKGEGSRSIPYKNNAYLTNNLAKSYLNEHREIMNLIHSEEKYLSLMIEQFSKKSDLIPKALVHSTQKKIAELQIKANKLQEKLNMIELQDAA